jgi:serine/threonine-protein kinase
VREVSAAGDYIGRYRIVRPLGEGGMGRVLLAEAAGAGGFQRRVVLKLVRDELDESLKHALLEEARLTATLVHRNIVPVLDLHESDAQRLVVLEYIDGMDLGQLLKRTPLVDWPLAAFIGGEVAAALDYAHRRQIIHRDVSPANILLSWEGEVKLGDFGVAKVVGERARRVGPTQGLKGKLGYMAPEQMQSQPIDARADVYALGVVMYEMLTGKNPMRQGPIAPPPLPTTVPRELAEVVLRAVERNRDKRFSSAADMREAIVHVAGQPADPARQLADFLGELRQGGGAVQDALLDAVLGGKAATRVAGAVTRSRRWGRGLAAAGLLIAVAGLGVWGALKLHRRAVAGAGVATNAVALPATNAVALPATNTVALPATKTVALPATKTVALPATKSVAPPATKTVAAPATESVAPPVEPTPPAGHHKHRAHGSLSVNAIPWANLFVDGKQLGHTPRRHLVLEAGHHQLRLVTQAGESRTRNVEILPNRDTTLTVVFSEP